MSKDEQEEATLCKEALWIDEGCIAGAADYHIHR